MTKKPILLVALILIALKINAQDDQNGFKFGVQIGSASSGFTQYQQVFTQHKLGLAGGVFAAFNLNSLIGISMDANYQLKGAFKVDPALVYPASIINYSGSSIRKESSEINLHTIQVPLLVNITPGKGEVQPVISLGYSFEYYLMALSQDMIVVDGISPIALGARSNENVSSSFQKWSMGPVAGVGVKFPGEKFDYTFQVRYFMGIRDINNLEELPSPEVYHRYSMNTLNFFLTVSFK